MATLARSCSTAAGRPTSAPAATACGRMDRARRPVARPSPLLPRHRLAHRALPLGGARGDITTKEGRFVRELLAQPAWLPADRFMGGIRAPKAAVLRVLKRSLRPGHPIWLCRTGSDARGDQDVRRSGDVGFPPGWVTTSRRARRRAPRRAARSSSSRNPGDLPPGVVAFADHFGRTRCAIWLCRLLAVGLVGGTATTLGSRWNAPDLSTALPRPGDGWRAGLNRSRRPGRGDGAGHPLSTPWRVAPCGTNTGAASSLAIRVIHLSNPTCRSAGAAVSCPIRRSPGHDGTPLYQVLTQFVEFMVRLDARALPCSPRPAHRLPVLTRTSRGGRQLAEVIAIMGCSRTRASRSARSRDSDSTSS